MTRIITGTAKKMNLRVPEKGTRPITDRAKSAVFSIIADWFTDEIAVLDLYAGSGSLGIEALSRGAKSVSFVDNNREAVECITENVKKGKFENVATIHQMHVKAFIKQTTDKFDLIFLDPPYSETNLEDLENSQKVLKSGGLIILKHSTEFTAPESVGNINLVESRTYGENVISFFQ